MSSLLGRRSFSIELATDICKKTTDYLHFDRLFLFLMAVAAAVPQVIQLISDGISVTEAVGIIADETKLENAALLAAYYRSSKRRNLSSTKAVHGNCKLSSEQALQFDLLTRIFAGMDLPWTCELAAEAIRELFEITVSTRWVQRYWKQDNQALRQVKALSKSRAGPGVVDKVGLFADQFQLDLDSRASDLQASGLVNVDQARIVMQGGKHL